MHCNETREKNMNTIHTNVCSPQIKLREKMLFDKIYSHLNKES